MKTIVTAFSILTTLGALAVHAQVFFTGNYSQNFDTLANTGTTATWTNNVTLQGWSLFRRPAPGTALTSYNIGNGSINAPAFYSFGTGTSTDRAFGGVAALGTYFDNPAAGTVAGWISVGFTNQTNSLLNSVTVRFNGEQWRNGGGNTPAAQTMKLEYGLGTSFTAVTTWTSPGGNFDWTSPVIGGTAAAVDGNVAGLVANRGGTLSGLNWANGTTLWLRWVENNDLGDDHGLAIDNFSISTVPEPSSYAAILGTVALFALAFRRRNASSRTI